MTSLDLRRAANAWLDFVQSRDENLRLLRRRLDVWRGSSPPSDKLGRACQSMTSLLLPRAPPAQQHELRASGGTPMQSRRLSASASAGLLAPPGAAAANDGLFSHPMRRLTGGGVVTGGGQFHHPTGRAAFEAPSGQTDAR